MKKYSLTLIIAAAIVLELMGAAQYFMAKRGVEQELLAKAERDIRDNQRVATVRAQVESAVRNILPNVEATVKTPNEFRHIVSQFVANNPNVVGAGVAFQPNFYGKEGLYAPYAFDNRPENELISGKKGQPNIHYNVLGFDYTDREWYTKPMKDGNSLWTEPYLDKGGTHILMCTYVMPVEVSDRTVGVFFADVPLKDVSILSQSLNSGISRSALIMLAIQLFSLLALGIIIWRAVQASRRYKEQYLDPEKEHLIEQLTKMREVNHRLTARNQDLAEKYAKLLNRLKADPQKSEPHYFG